MEIIHTESEVNKPMPLGILLSMIIVTIVLISLFSLGRVYARDMITSSEDCACFETATLVCHMPLNTFESMYTIRIGEAAIEEHLAHGDTPGACAGETEHAQQFERQCICSNGDMGYLAYSDNAKTRTYTSVAMNILHRISDR